MLLILILTGGMVLQAALPIRTALPEDNGVAPRRLRSPLPTTVPAYGAILQAPIFAPDRRPEGQAPAQSLQLIGIAANGRSTGSAIVLTQDGASHVLKAGDSVDGWRLVAVSSGHAIFDGAAGRAVLSVTVPSVPNPGPAVAKTPVTP